MAPQPLTRHSLLIRLTDGCDSAAWAEFVETYEQPVLRYCISHGLQEADALDVMQEVLLAVHGAAADWKPTGRPGSFRKWLLRTAHNHCLKSLRNGARRDRAAGGTSVQKMLNDVADMEASSEQEVEWRRWAFYWAANQVQREVAQATWQAFWLAAVVGMPPAQVAEKTGLSIGSVYAAKCRVIRRIGERVEELSRVEL
ncbi:MAG: sigma-70 family RNA polymerase sigma factor [Planctomycetales bacterium]|nr:sigma-70 family RNA polymerase sigma factor [Planctomycetales bacterium]